MPTINSTVAIAATTINSDFLNQDEEAVNYVDMIKKLRDRIPFWEMYQDFLA
jgi:hypothetical protein